MAPALPRRLDTAALISHRFAFADAEAAYTLVTEMTEPHLAVVLAYPEGQAAAPVFPAARTAADGGCVLGMIGAGNFARTVLLPELKRIRGVRLHTVADQGAAIADHAGGTFGFAAAVTDPQAVLDDPQINAVVIATRHDSHADLTARALAAGKAVLVEKPLGLSREEINRVIAARNESPAFFQVGFNRRFAPMARDLRRHIEGRPGPRFILARVNAGGVPAESWLHGAEGGGRILGEVCHFIDLARFFAGAAIVSVQADAAAVGAGTCDDLTVTLRFADGSLATVAYTALGDTAFSKELFEVYAGGSVATVDNFRTMTITENGRVSKRSSRGGQDKGFRGALEAFAGAVASGGPAPIDESELVESSLATIAVLESLRDGGRIDMEFKAGHR